VRPWVAVAEVLLRLVGADDPGVMPMQVGSWGDITHIFAHSGNIVVRNHYSYAIRSPR
jgi:hypothetical protein